MSHDHVVTVIGKARAASMFPSKWEAQDFAARIKEKHPELNVFVAPLLPDPFVVNWARLGED